MGFHEDDRIRHKNKEQKNKEKTYNLILDKKCDLARLVVALDLGGYKVELCEDGTTIIVR